MSAPAGPFSRAEANPQSVQKLLDENAQLIRALVENMNVKGKSMECIQYQQTLHRNLVYLASLADPNLNLQSILPPPASGNMMRMSSSSQAQVTTSAPYSIPPPVSMTQQQRQPQAMTTGVSTSQQAQWSIAQSQSIPGSVSSMRVQPPLPQMPGQFGDSATMVGMRGSMWGGQGLYGMQRPVGGGPMSTSLSQEERRRQILRMQQEQMIQVQQARRMQQQQLPVSTMEPGPAHMYPPPPPGPSMMPTGLPPAYSQATTYTMSQLPPHTMHLGPMNM